MLAALAASCFALMRCGSPAKDRSIPPLAGRCGQRGSVAEIVGDGQLPSEKGGVPSSAEDWLQIGMSRRDVEDLLGEPESRSGSAETWIYRMAHGSAMDHNYLHIYFDKFGAVIAWAVLQG